jgi:hypothetical protein
MCFALFIAAGSFFSIRERVAAILPEPFTTGPMRALPILLVVGAMCYWLWQQRRTSPADGSHHPARLLTNRVLASRDSADRSIRRQHHGGDRNDQGGVRGVRSK